MARKDIDAVCISTPDHWHAIQAVAAAEAGKDIYCEKPLSHTLNEGIAMVRAAQKNRCVWQTGSCSAKKACSAGRVELVQNGYLGKVTRVEVGLPAGHWTSARPQDLPDGPVPDGVDYDFWIGPRR